MKTLMHCFLLYRDSQTCFNSLSMDVPFKCDMKGWAYNSNCACLYLIFDVLVLLISVSGRCS